VAQNGVQVQVRLMLHVAGFFLLMLALSLCAPLAVALFYGDGGILPFAASIAATALPGALLIWLFPRKYQSDISIREAILLVVALWTAMCLFGALPFLLHPAHFTPLDALFEAISGFTTTGASILSDVEALPRSVMFWRCFTQWLGGLGIVLLGVAILPMLGGSGYQLFRAQGGMLKSEKLRPRVAEAARALWAVYVSMSLLEYTTLRIAGMDWFDAACHTFATVATGGFSTRNAGVGAFSSPLAEYLIVLFMFAASIHFALHFQLARTRDIRVFWRSSEFRFFTALMATSTVFCGAALWAQGNLGPEETFRKALFMSVSIGSTTGFANADYNAWPIGTQILMLVLMFCGGNGGSTAGGLKSFRIVLALKNIARHMRRMVEWRAVIGVRLNGSMVPDELVAAAMQLIPIAFLIYAGSAILLATLGCDLATSLSAPATTMFGVGPGWGAVGPMGSFAEVPATAKAVLMACMFCGRLEFFTVILLFTPGFWRR
jgi:trk system potassium uptake protein